MISVFKKGSYGKLYISVTTDNTSLFKEIEALVEKYEGEEREKTMDNYKENVEPLDNSKQKKAELKTAFDKEKKKIKQRKKLKNLGDLFLFCVTMGFAAGLGIVLGTRFALFIL